LGLEYSPVHSPFSLSGRGFVRLVSLS